MRDKINRITIIVFLLLSVIMLPALFAGKATAQEISNCSSLSFFVPSSCTDLVFDLPAVSATCYDIKAFDINWNQLSALQLSQLSLGETVRFTVQGQSSTGAFTKARFTINGVLQPEVTNKRPGTDEFYYEYTISSYGPFTIEAEVYHEILGWT